MKAGTRTRMDKSSGFCGCASPDVDEQPQVLLADVLLHETAQRAAGAVEGLAEIDADVLGGERGRRNDKSRYTGRADAAAPRKLHQILPAGRPNKLAISCSRLS